MKKNIICALLITLIFCLCSLPCLCQDQPAGKMEDTGNTTDKWKDSPGEEQYPDESALILYDYVGKDLLKDSTIRYQEHAVVKLLQQSAFERFGKVSRLFIAPHQSIKVETARIIKPSGAIIDLGKDSINVAFSLGSKIPLYKDMGILEIDFSKAEVGDIIEFKLTGTDNRPFIKDYFWGISYINDDAPLIYTELKIRLFKPNQVLNYYTKDVDNGKMKPVITEEDGAKVYTWSLKNRPATVDEPLSPAFRDRTGWIMVSTFPGWDSMSKAYSKALEPYTRPGPKVKAKTATLIKGIKDKKAIFQKIAGFLKSRKTVELGFEADHPCFFDSDSLLESRILSNADAQILFLAMLKSAGIEAYPALFSDYRGGGVISDIPCPCQFNHIITCYRVDDQWHYYDATSTPDYPSNLYSGKQGRGVLVLKPAGASLALTPLSKPEENLEEIQVTATLSSDASLGANMRIVETGTKKALWESVMGYILNPGQRTAIFERLLKVINSDCKLLGSDISDNREKKSFEVNLAFMCSDYAMVSGKYWIIKLPMIPTDARKEIFGTGADERKLPVELGNTGIEKKNLTMSLPENVKIVSTPENVTLKNSVGELYIKCDHKDKTIEYAYFLKIYKPTIPADKYGELQEIYRTAEKSTREVILLTAE